MKKLLLITLIIFSANSIAEDVGLKCDTDNANSPKPPATKLLIIEERNKPRRSILSDDPPTRKNPEVLCRKGGLIVPCKEKVASEFSILEGKWSQDVVIKENPSTYQFYTSNSGDRAFNLRVSYTLSRSNLSMVSHEEKCVARDFLNYNKCTQYNKITNDSYWQCRKMSEDRIREYAAEILKDITQDNQI